jgi:hypothetical protein
MLLFHDLVPDEILNYKYLKNMCPILNGYVAMNVKFKMTRKDVI